MSRAFVKEADVESVADEAPARPRSAFPNYVTPAGLQKLHDRLQELQQRRRDVEGCEDLASRQEISVLERDLRYYGELVNSAILIDPSTQPDDRVNFGATVEVDVGGGGDVQRFTIVGEDEADAAAGKISWISPLAKVLLNARVGDWVTWRRPAGDVELEVLAILKSDADAARGGA